MAYVHDTDLAGTGAGQGAAMVGFKQTGTDAVNRTADVKLRELPYTPQDFGAPMNGVDDDAEAIMNAIKAGVANGRAIFLPEGNYRLNQQILLRPNDWLPFFIAGTQGPLIFGAGVGKTILTSHVDDLAAIDIAPGTDFSAFTCVVGLTLRGFRLVDGGANNGSGIKLRSALHAVLEDLWIESFDGDGIKIECLDGDNDGSVYTTIARSVVLGCKRWGLDIAGAPDKNEISFMRVHHCWLEANGTAPVAFNGTTTNASAVVTGITNTADLLTGMVVTGPGIPANAKIVAKTSSSITLSAAATAGPATVALTAGAFSSSITPGVNEPVSGGIRWKGQSGEIVSCGLTANRNVSLLVPGGDGAAGTLVVRNTAFENCIDRAVLITGLTDGRFEDCHAYSAAAYQTKVCFETVGTVYSLNSVVYANPRIRVTSEHTCTAFKNTAVASTATNKGVHIEGDVVWQEFGKIDTTTGLTNHTGFAGDWDFDVGAAECELTYNANTVTFGPSAKGNKALIRKRWGGSQSFESGNFKMTGVRSAGISSELAADGLWNVYLFDAGNVLSLEFSTDAPTASFGRQVKSTQPGKVYVGRACRIGGTLQTGAAARFCNPRWDPALGGYVWLDSGNQQRVKASLPASDTDGTAI